MRARCRLPILLTLACLAVRAPGEGPAPTIVPAGAKLEKVWGEGAFTEGPAYGPGGCVYFSDIGGVELAQVSPGAPAPGNRIMRYDPATGRTTVYRRPSGQANGLDFDPQGRLVAAEGANT